MKKNIFYIKIKRFFDILISGLLLIVLWPFFFLIAIAIKLEDSEGPVLFKQERLGKYGKPFVIYKFRSMIVNSEKVTRIGRLIRLTSIDELPQLVNILKGDMSIIGPRPLKNEYEEFTTEQKRRFEVRPGLTGLAQISGRKALTLEKKCEYDVKYVNSMCFTLDLKIFFSTFGVVLTNFFSNNY